MCGDVGASLLLTEALRHGRGGGEEGGGRLGGGLAGRFHSRAFQKLMAKSLKVVRLNFGDAYWELKSCVHLDTLQKKKNWLVFGRRQENIFTLPSLPSLPPLKTSLCLDSGQTHFLSPPPCFHAPFWELFHSSMPGLRTLGGIVSG